MTKPEQSNSGVDILNQAAQSQLRSGIERIERLLEDKAAISSDISEFFQEMKHHGFDVKIVRKVIKLRATDKAKRQEESAMIDLYMNAIGEP